MPTARSWTPANYRAQYRRQLRLSTGALRTTLAQAAPSRQELAAYRADRARSEATVVTTRGQLQTATQARYEVVVDERSMAAGQTLRQRLTYVVELVRRDGAWRVAGFSSRP